MGLCLVISIPLPHTSVSGCEYWLHSPGTSLRVAKGGGDTCVSGPGSAAQPHLWPLSPPQLSGPHSRRCTACRPSPRPWWGEACTCFNCCQKGPTAELRARLRLHRDCPRPTSRPWPPGQPPSHGVPCSSRMVSSAGTWQPREPANGHRTC